MKDVDRCMFFVGFCRKNVRKSLKFQRLCDIINLQFRDLQFSCIKETKRERQNCKFTVPPGESPPPFPLTQEKREPHTQAPLHRLIIEIPMLCGIYPQTALFSEVSLQQAFKSGTVSGFILAHFVNCRTAGHGENVGISKDMGV